jgi:hypothetical protein
VICVCVGGGVNVVLPHKHGFILTPLKTGSHAKRGSEGEIFRDQSGKCSGRWHGKFSSNRFLSNGKLRKMLLNFQT